jgi:hypothetical protein
MITIRRLAPIDGTTTAHFLCLLTLDITPDVVSHLQIKVKIFQLVKGLMPGGHGTNLLSSPLLWGQHEKAISDGNQPAAQPNSAPQSES